MPECRRRGQTRHFSSSGTGKIGTSTWLVWCLKEPDNTVLVYRFLRGTTSGSNRFGGGSPMVCQPCPQTGEPPTCNHNRWGRIPTNCKVCRRVVFVGKNNALPRNILCSMQGSMRSGIGSNGRCGCAGSRGFRTRVQAACRMKRGAWNGEALPSDNYIRKSLKR